MENKLKRLFDYQRFEKNDRLKQLISDSESRFGKELSDDDLSGVFAAGEPENETIPGGLTGDYTGNCAGTEDQKNKSEVIR